MTRLRGATSQSPVDLILSAYLENHPDTPDPARLRQAVAQTLAELAPGSAVLAEALAQAAHRLRGTAPAIGQRNSEAAMPRGDIADAQSVEESEPGETDEPPPIRRRTNRRTAAQQHTLGQSSLTFEFQPEEHPATISDEAASPFLVADQPDPEADALEGAVAPASPDSGVGPQAEALEHPRKRKRPSRPASRRRKTSLDVTSAEEPGIERSTTPNGDSHDPEAQAEPDHDTETQPVRHTAESVFQNFPHNERSQPGPMDRSGSRSDRRYEDE
jgi:hypothetical protein